MDETTQAWLDSKFDSSGEPVADAPVEPLGDDFDFVTDTPRFTSESQLADLYTQANNDEAAVSRTQFLVDQANFDNLALQEQLVDDQLLAGYEYGEPQYEQPAWIPPAPDGVDPASWAESYQVARQVTDEMLATQAAQALQPQQPTAEQQFTQMMAAATTESLANLAAIEEGKAARGAQQDAEAEAVYAQQVSQAEQVADDLIGRALERHDARGHDRSEVMQAASAVMVQNGWVGPEFDALPDWQRVEFAKSAIDQAAEAAGAIAIMRNTLGPHWRYAR